MHEPMNIKFDMSVCLSVRTKTVIYIWYVCFRDYHDYDRQTADYRKAMQRDKGRRQAVWRSLHTDRESCTATALPNL